MNNVFACFKLGTQIEVFLEVDPDTNEVLEAPGNDDNGRWILCYFDSFTSDEHVFCVQVFTESMGLPGSFVLMMVDLQEMKWRWPEAPTQFTPTPWHLTGEDECDEGDD